MITPEVEDLLSASKTAIEEQRSRHGWWEDNNGVGPGDLPEWVTTLEAAVEAVENAQ